MFEIKKLETEEREAKTEYELERK